MWREMLYEFGARPIAEHVVTDGKFITAGGVTAEIDFGLSVIAAIAGRDAAERIQLAIEYNPSRRSMLVLRNEHVQRS
jgi:cyclohexyl-isocyanide hydratase